ncbi:MAG TPA: M23 family metallopeptidase [Beutenbergiaceae bacterium]|nr:M23 family metallopeptidase [Beutenbergiaceae bacterium]
MVLAALGLATCVVPIAGFGLAEAEEEPQEVITLGTDSALDVLGADEPLYATGEGNSLSADPEATGRALVTASRSSADREALQCGSSALEANGQLAAETSTAPVDVIRPLAAGSYRLTSQYGYRIHPIFGSYAEHTGLDFAASAGTPIHAIADGEVTHAGEGRDGRSGQLVIIEHELNGQSVWSWYVHMYPDGVYVDVGQRVNAGDVIGAVGSYGNSTGPHLHLEIHVDENLTTVDPAIWLDENGAEPLTSDTLACAEN